MLEKGTIIQWRRFWCPLGSTINCDARGGFLVHRDDEVGRRVNTSIVSLLELWQRSGPLILCGEPGMGKSTEVNGIRQFAEAQAAEKGDHCLWFVFREMHDFADFRRQTIEDAQWHRWREGVTMLNLIVDGVDEGLLRVPNFVNDLAGMLKSEPLDRLKIVLVCRTAEWPVETGRALLSLWKSGHENAVFELCPLRVVDANEAAVAWKCDADAFRNAVWDRGVSGLASRPVTLFFLLDEFRHGQGLPATHCELYEKGISRLVREVDPIRTELLRRLRKTAIGATDKQRERAARRLAALLLLAGRSAISISDETSANHRVDLLLREAEDDNDEAGAVNEVALREAVESALFTSLGEQRFGFVHQTIAECLAAQLLRAMPLVQVRRLLCQRDSRGEHVVPQLAELSAWVAGYHTDFCQHLLRIEPEALVRSDVTRLNNSMKAQLVDALLEGAQREKIFDKEGFDRFLDGLAHPEIAHQLRPVLANSIAGLIARRVALELVLHCRVVELVDDLVALVCDLTSSQMLRERAAYALESIVPDEKLEVFEPLARGEVGKDPDDTIRGCALQRLVPKRWKVRDALPHIRPQQNHNLYGSYYAFLEYHMLQHLEDEDIAPLLVWLQRREGYFDSLHPASNLAQAALGRGWQLVQREDVLSALVELCHTFVANHHHHLLRRERKNANPEPDTTQRRIFAAAYLNHPSVKAEEIFWLDFDTEILSCRADLEWMLDELPNISPQRLPVWVELVFRMTWRPEEAASAWDKLLQRINEIPALATKFEWLCDWKLDEPRARKAKADWLRHERQKRKWAEQRQIRKRCDLRLEIEKAIH